MQATKDERATRRYRATIDLTHGRAAVRELPTDPRGEASPVVAAQRAQPLHHDDGEGPLRPWERGAPAPERAVHVPAAPPGFDGTPPTGPRTFSTQVTDELVEQITENVVDRLRGALGLPQEEPPIAPLDADPIPLAGPHVAGGFMHDVEDGQASPGGAFAEGSTVGAPHPAGAFADPE